MLFEQKKRARNMGIMYLLAAAVTLVVFAIGGDGGRSTFGLGEDSSFSVAGVPLAWFVAVCLAALGGVQLARGLGKWTNAALAAAASPSTITYAKPAAAIAPSIGSP